ncbi:hypothetical protein T05_311 [Trichinella murrelli]|uniref:Secreted protein n=1 Tax=Trichinella murrelli TaxID=144512 RepID=A0A0V0T455_9BILA|nr:hypothetical protein T05_311 [Trichinella murrelli]
MKAPLALLFSFLGGKFGGSSLYARTLMFWFSATKCAIVRTIEWPLLLSIDSAEGAQAGFCPDCIIFVCKAFGASLSALQVATPCAQLLLSDIKITFKLLCIYLSYHLLLRKESTFYYIMKINFKPLS